MADTYTYDVYGEPRAATGAQDNEFQFTGQQVDATTSLQYLRARYYDMESGVFLSRDPLTGAQGWSGHPFAYVGGNPARLIDPFGLCPKYVKKACEVTVQVVDKTVLDPLAYGSYGLYYVSYQALGVVDGFSELFGPGEVAVDTLLAGVTLPLTVSQGVGLAGDVVIDEVKALLGTGPGPNDEGYVGSVCPDVVVEWLNLPCPKTYLPGVSTADVCIPSIVREYPSDTVRRCVKQPPRVDFRWPWS